MYRTIKEMQFVNGTLRELSLMCKLYISGNWLFRTTVASLNMSSKQVSRKRKENLELVSKISSLIEKRMYLCEGDRMDVAAHMTVILLPVNVFIEKLNIDARKKMNSCAKHQTRDKYCSDCKKMNFMTSRQEQTFYKILRTMMIEYKSNLEKFQRQYHSHERLKNYLDIIVCEGTGEFDATNSEDPYLTERRSIVESTKSFELGKYKIYHPTYDPEQFFLNAISFVTSYFLREHNFPISTFLCTYDPNVYAITFVDLAEHGEYNILPVHVFNKDEMKIIENVGKRQIAMPSLKTIDSLKFKNLKEVEQRISDNMIKLSDFFVFSKTKYYGKEQDREVNSNKLLMLKDVLGFCVEIKQTVNREKKKQHHGKSGTTGTLLYTCNPQMFFIDGFIQNMINGLVYNKYVKEVDFYQELYGPLLKNIVFVVKI